MSESKVDFRRRKKQAAVENALSGDHVMVHLDSTRQDVDLPDNLRGNPALTLKISYRFQGKVEVTREGISAHLRFDGSYHHCQIPWDAVWGITPSEAQNNILWHEDMPKELVIELAKQRLKELGGKLLGRKTKPPSEGTTKTNKLSRNEPSSTNDTTKEKKHPRAPQLTRIK